MKRLSALDAEFLHLEDGVSHMHIAGMSVFEGTAPTETEIQNLLLAKLDRIPRYRQRIRSVPLEIGRPVWVDDPHFNVAYHVRETALVQPADEASVCRLMGRLMSQELDRNRPLWECWIIHGLPEGRWALVSKVHHCMVDGIAGVGLLEALLDVEPDAALPDPDPWTPEAEPSAVDLVVESVGGLVSDVGERISSVPDHIGHPIATVRSMAATGLGLVRLTRHLGFTPPLSVEGPIGPHRVWAHSSTTLDVIRSIRDRWGGTVNDVVLAAVTNGYRELLIQRGDDLDDAVLRTLVPVSVRPAQATGAADNRVSAILYDLPIRVTDPVERLEQVKTQMAELKVSHMPEAGEAVTAFADLLPPMLVGNTTRILMRLVHDHPQRSLNTVTTNVPGPQFPLFCLGRRMVEHRPFVPISHGIRVGTAILSYDGRLCFGVTGDLDSTSDVEVMAQGIAAGVDELAERARA